MIIALALLTIAGCEKKEQGLPELPELKVVEDVCEQMVDINFMSYCYENFDVNKDGKVSMSEAQAVSVIECNTAKDFSGIEYFKNLTEFKSSSVKALNIGYAKKLVSIDCSGSQLETMDLRYNTLVSKIYFIGCSSLTSVSFPVNLESINSGAFCRTGLTSLSFPAGLTSIGSSAFNGCSDLTSVCLPESLISIGELAFSYCPNLMDVKVLAVNPPNLVHLQYKYVYPFTEIHSNAVLRVPAESVSAYKSSTWFNDFKTIVAIE